MKLLITGFDPFGGAQLNPSWAAVQQLPDDQRDVLLLRDFQDLSYDEIGDMLSLPLGTVKSRIKRAREKLKRILCAEAELFSGKYVHEYEGRHK